MFGILYNPCTVSADICRSILNKLWPQTSLAGSTISLEGRYGHYIDVIMTTMASQITSLMVVYSTVSSGADQRKHQSYASLTIVWGIHRWPVNSPHKWPVTRKMFPFDDVIMHHSLGQQSAWIAAMVIDETFSRSAWNSVNVLSTSVDVSWHIVKCIIFSSCKKCYEIAFYMPYLWNTNSF